MTKVDKEVEDFVQAFNYERPDSKLNGGRLSASVFKGKIRIVKEPRGDINIPTPERGVTYDR